LLDECLHQSVVAETAGDHQRCLVEDVAEIHAVFVGLAQDPTRILQPVEHVVVAVQQLETLFRIPRGWESGLDQSVDQHLIVVHQGVFEQADAGFLLPLLQRPVV